MAFFPKITMKDIPFDVVVLGLAAASYVIFLLHRWRYNAGQATSFVPVKSSTSGETDALESKSIITSMKAGQGNHISKNIRAFGEWSPDYSWSYPPITPLEKKIEDVPPRPYRPVKDGEYKITMGIRKLNLEDWIEPDSQLASYHRIRSHRLATRYDKLVRVLPDRPGLVKGAAEAARELVYELAEFLSRRYPKVYAVTRHPVTSSSGRGDDCRVIGDGWYGEGRIKEITILPLDVVYNLDDEEPMKVVALLTQDDMAIMIEGEDGQYYFQAGAILVPGSWRLEDKIGMPLDEIHFTGEVPLYKENLQPSMTRFFRRLTPSSPVARNNWTLQTVDPSRRHSHHTNSSLGEGEKVFSGSSDGEVVDVDELAWFETQTGDEDAFNHPLSSYKLSQLAASTTLVPPSSSTNSATSPPPTQLPSIPQPRLDYPVAARIRFRSERQTLRRLPLTGAIVFTIRVYTTGMEEMKDEPGMPGRLAGAIRGLGRSRGGVAERKRQEGDEKELLECLDGWHREQVENGMVEMG